MQKAVPKLGASPLLRDTEQLQGAADGMNE